MSEIIYIIVIYSHIQDINIQALLTLHTMYGLVPGATAENNNQLVHN